MKTDLFTSLRKYRTTDKKNPVENFVTEAFAWLLKNIPDFSFFFITELKKKMNSTEEIPKILKWDTQRNFDGVFPDMICEFENSVFVFENQFH